MDNWARRRLGDRRLGDKTFGRHGQDDWAISLGDSVNIIHTVIRQVMCKGRADRHHPVKCTLFSQLYGGSHSYYVDGNSSKWHELQQIHMDWSSQFGSEL